MSESFKTWDIVKIKSNDREYIAYFWYYMTANPEKAAVIIRYTDGTEEEDVRWVDVDELSKDKVIK